MKLAPKEIMSSWKKFAKLVPRTLNKYIFRFTHLLPTTQRIEDSILTSLLMLRLKEKSDTVLFSNLMFTEVTGAFTPYNE